MRLLAMTLCVALSDPNVLSALPVVKDVFEKRNHPNNGDAVVAAYESFQESENAEAQTWKQQS